MTVTLTVASPVACNVDCYIDCYVAASDMTRPPQACHDQYEWAPGCVAREDLEPQPERLDEIELLLSDEVSTEAGDPEDEPLDVD